jgi:arabinose-5-phosphate isomerase
MPSPPSQAGTPPAQRPSQPASSSSRKIAQQVIRAEAEAIAGLELDESFDRAVEIIETCADTGGTVLVTGLGKSGLIGAKVSATMASLGIASHPVHPTEAAHGDLGRFRSADVVLALSFSGETTEVIDLVTLLRQDKLPIVSMTRKPDGDPPSSLWRLSTAALALRADDDGAGLGYLAPTASTTAMLALGDALAIAVAHRRGFSREEFARRHPGGALGGLLRPAVDMLRFRVGENVPLISEGATVLEAEAQAASFGRRPGAILIVDGNGRLAGIFTDGDFRRLMIGNRGALDRPIGEVMTRDPRTLPDSAIAHDAVQLIRETRQDEIPVVTADGRPVGILDVQDLIAMKLVQE